MLKTNVIKSMVEHFTEARQYFESNQIVGLFLQGSQNYGLDNENSDVDTKLIVVPSFRDIALNRKPVSTTHVRANNEHIDWKDIRLYMETFRKQNLNFLEILFTDYAFVNPVYQAQWSRLVDAREQIARMNEWRAVKSMKGVAMEKYHAMEHEYPSKVEVLAKFGYDPKQVSHLVRVEEYLERYINGELYKDCLLPVNKDFILDIKLGKYNLMEARDIANKAMKHVIKLADTLCNNHTENEDAQMRTLLEDVQYEVMKIAVSFELKKV